jgi:hypothetical protein
LEGEDWFRLVLNVVQLLAVVNTVVNRWFEKGWGFRDELND